MSQAQEHTGTVKKHPRQIKGAAVFVAQGSSIQIHIFSGTDGMQSRQAGARAKT